MPYWLLITITALLCYCIGNINNAIIISKLKRRDVRKEGSGNPGTMNMLRNFGTVLGALTLLLDVLKGALAALLGWYLLGKDQLFSLGSDALGVYVGGLAVIVGHIFPVFLKFKGGKGIAASIGVCFVINPVVTAITFAIGILFIIITKMGAVTSFIIISFPLAIEALTLSAAVQAGELEFVSAVVYSLLMFAIFMLAFTAHRKNLYALFAGTESRTSIFSKYKNKRKS